MDLNGQLVLSYIEEDNIQKAFFRVRPLLCEKGLLTGEDFAAYPDNGYMRVVPDKNEQHTFKERMRSLGSLCLIDLKNVKPDYSKVRNNKNYSPERGEYNQFIIYSDAVKSIPQNVFFEVLSGENAQSGVTPVIFTRNGANIQGPYLRNGEKAADGVLHIRPDCAELYAVICPDEKEHLIYWPHESLQLKNEIPETAKVITETIENEKPAEKAAVAVQAAKEAALQNENGRNAEGDPQDAYEIIRNMDAGLQVKTNKLKENEANTQEAAPAPAQVPAQDRRSLNGTPFYKPGNQQTNMQKCRNYLCETVERQRFAGRYEAAGAEIDDAGKLKTVSNPVEAFNTAFSAAWRMMDVRDALIKTVCQADGSRVLLCKALGASDTELTQAAFKSQLQEMEAERLMQLMRLDELKASREKLFGEAIQAAKEGGDKTIREQESIKEDFEKTAAQIRVQEKELLSRRDQTIANVRAFAEGSNIIAAPQGEKIAFDVVAERIHANLKKAGFSLDMNLAKAMLLAKTISRDIHIVSVTMEDAILAAEAFCKALGAAYTTDYPDTVCAGGSGYKLYITKYAEGYKWGQIIVSTVTENDPERDNSVPMFLLRQNRRALPEEAVVYPSADEAYMIEQVRQSEGVLPQEAVSLIQKMRETLPENLPAKRVISVQKFARAGMNCLSGGIATALDLAVTAYIVTFIKNEINGQDMKNAISESMIYAREALK